MPEGVAEGAARRIGEDIFNEVHRALAADRNLSEQVAGVLSDRRFDLAQQARVASLLAGRAKQLVPSVARRVIGEWTSGVPEYPRDRRLRGRRLRLRGLILLRLAGRWIRCRCGRCRLAR